MKIRLIAMSFFFALIIPRPFYGETVFLKDGSQIVGEITSQDRGSITINTKFKTMTISKDKIKRIAYKSSEKGSMQIIVQKNEWANIYLMNGSVLSGNITYRDDQSLKINTAKGEVTVRKNDINAIDYVRNDAPSLSENHMKSTVRIGSLVTSLSGFKGIITSAVFSRDGKYLAAGTDRGEITLYSAVDFSKVSSMVLESNNSATSLAMTADSSQLIVGCGDYTVWVIQFSDGVLKPVQGMKAHSNSIADIAIHPAGIYAASCGLDLSINLWDLKRRSLIKQFKDSNEKTRSAYKLCFVNNGNTLISAHESGEIVAWSVPSGAILKKIQGHSDRISGLSKSDNGQVFLTSGFDNAIKLWNAQTTTPFASLKVHNDSIFNAAISREANFAVSGAFDSRIRVFHIGLIIKKYLYSRGTTEITVETAAELSKIQGYNQIVLLSNDMKYLVGAGSEKIIKVWNIEGQK